MIPYWTCKIDETGNLLLPSGLDFKVYCDSHQGQQMELTLEKLKNTRSLDQNAYLWAIYKAMADTTGHTVVELHEIMKRLYLTPKYVDYKGQKIKMPGSTRDLSVSQFMEYLERVKQEAAELGCIITDQVK